MQLIEIIQLALLFFVALSAIIFLFSYLGYRSKSKLKEIPKSGHEVKKTGIKESKVVEDPNKNLRTEKQVESVKQNPKFEVYTPNLNNNLNYESKKPIQKQSHSPKTLVIKNKS